MSQGVLRLELPEDVYERVRRAAKGMKQPLEKALVKIVRAATPPLEKVPVSVLRALRLLSWPLRSIRPTRPMYRLSEHSRDTAPYGSPLGPLAATIEDCFSSLVPSSSPEGSSE